MHDSLIVYRVYGDIGSVWVRETEHIAIYLPPALVARVDTV
jgi:hypothetical protein